jgi:S-methylmethionine-dependent homocysteine/selenocysteine methylase
MSAACEHAKEALLQLHLDRAGWKTAERSVYHFLKVFVERRAWLRRNLPNSRLESFLLFWERVTAHLSQEKLPIDDAPAVERVCREADDVVVAWRNVELPFEAVETSTSRAAHAIGHAVKEAVASKERQFQEAKTVQLALFFESRRLRDSTDMILLDGGVGRELFSIGAPFRQPEWSSLSLMEAPHFVSMVHNSFVAAGCDVITTNTYAVVPSHLGAKVFAERGAALASLAGKLAREAAGTAVRVAGSLPPLASYETVFDLQEAVSVSRVLVDALRQYVDLWLIETQSTSEEAQAIYEQTLDKPVWVSFTVDDEDGTRLRGGELVRQVVDRIASWPRVEVVLFNCSGRTAVLQAVRAAEPSRRFVKLGVYANAFEHRSVNSPKSNESILPTVPIRPSEYAAWCKECAFAGASVFGGCCGISPIHIASVRKEMSSWQAP